MTEANRPNSDIISALAGGEIEAGEAAAVQAAIDADNDLSDDYQSLLATAELLATAPAARAPRNYASALPPVEIRSRWTRFTPTLLASAAVALIAFALVDLQGSQVGAPDRARAESRTAISAAAPALAESPLAKVQAVEIEPAVVTESRVEAA
ncbi:MAG: hypothetical protein QGG58_11590, partial [Chloroflexota bacterium]|nr:hypothetical protein [Chloroflexota bacterium]